MMLCNCGCGIKGKQKIKTGMTNLLLHGGSALPWLSSADILLAGEVVQARVCELGGRNSFGYRIHTDFRHFPASLDSTGTPLEPLAVTTGALKIALSQRGIGMPLPEARE
jgi:hypothetical protein